MAAANASGYQRYWSVLVITIIRLECSFMFSGTLDIFMPNF